ncbi:rod shape-determining protein MreC [Tenacibaculum amylolyticum]|uniref:rod shape-determining protein MreC n=1 Tax=Tenacibaculum amylolyticum TaxID=104269 RepID=UPI003895F1EB
MQQLIYFIQRYKYLLFFCLLQIIALALTINSHSFHRSKFISSANVITGGIYEKTNAFSNYLNLGEQNKALAKENTYLKNLLSQIQSISDSVKLTAIIDSLNNQQYKYIDGVIVKNEFHKAYNYLTVNRGAKQEVTPEMAVINDKGIIGVTDAVSNSYARVRSILSRNSQINARLQHSPYYGTLSWDAKNNQIIQLRDIPRQAVVQIGDTIITSGRSAIFPEGILVGTVIDIEKRAKENLIEVKLFNDMSSIRDVYIINNFHKQEIKDLEKQTNE